MKNINIKSVFEYFIPPEETKKRIYESIILKQKRKGKTFKIQLKAKLAYSFAICLILAILLFAFLRNPKLTNNSLTTEPDNTFNYLKDVSAERSKLSEKDEEDSIFNGFIFTAYAADDETMYLNANYMEDSTKIELTPDVKVLLAKYSLAMSSVPGLPFTINISKDDIDDFNIDTIKVYVDNGELNNWNRDTGVVTSEGQSIIIDFSDTGETIYWSPYFDINATNLEKAQITVEAISDNTVIGRQNIYITQDKNGYYYATVGILELL